MLDWHNFLLLWQNTWQKQFKWGKDHLLVVSEVSVHCGGAEHLILRWSGSRPLLEGHVPWRVETIGNNSEVSCCCSFLFSFLHLQCWDWNTLGKYSTDELYPSLLQCLLTQLWATRKWKGKRRGMTVVKAANHCQWSLACFACVFVFFFLEVASSEKI
jgi:hypothetical protein